MEWILKSPQIHNAFTSLGYMSGDVYHINENSNSILEEILKNILNEDKSLRSYRRTVSFGQNVQKDLMPLLINSKNNEVIGFVIKILMNLTIPVEYLLSIEVATRTDFGRHTIFELQNLLCACKNAFVDPRAVKVVIDFLKNNSGTENKQQSKLSMKQCEHIHDCLTLLRNVLHIPDEGHRPPHAHAYHTSTVQNQIFWNMFSSGLDKLIITLMTIPEASNWSATMVQLVALLYKDQHVGKLQKLVNVWLETSLSESSEDNESNTSPQMRGSVTSSSMLTTDQATSDSSDNSAKMVGENESNNDLKNENTKPTGDVTKTHCDNSLNASDNDKASNGTLNSEESKDFESKIPQKEIEDHETTKSTKLEETIDTKKSEMVSNKRSIEDFEDEAIGDQGSSQQSFSPPPTKMCRKGASENSDCGYGTQLENRTSISTSSNEEYGATTKPVHIKPHNPKHKANTKTRINNKLFVHNHEVALEDKRRKKMVKRGKSNILNVKGLQYHQPTDDDIVLVLKEFTIDFMLKGYSSLVKTLHKQILNYNDIEIDRCHFFWLVTYFLRFATQMELELEHVDAVLSFDVVSFLTAEGVNLCEQFEKAVKYNKIDLNVCRRKLHLVVTAIREFVQAVEVFKKMWIPIHESEDPLILLQLKMWETDELRSLLVLLIRNYNSDYHDKQYFQDLVVTNHLLLLFLDNVKMLPGYNVKLTMLDHIRQFATPHMMWQYGVLLKDYETNGEFVNDCVFTIMHHVGGSADSLQTLYRSNILQAFSSIKKSDYEICDQWTDLVEYVMNSFARQSASNQRKCGANTALPEHTQLPTAPPTSNSIFELANVKDTPAICSKWAEDELSALGWNYMQSINSNDVVGDVVILYRETGILKSRTSVIDELYYQSLIDKDQHQEFIKSENHNNEGDAIRIMCDELSQEGHGAMLDWVQSVLLEVCYVKISLAKILSEEEIYEGDDERLSTEYICNKFKHVVSPVAYHNILLNKPIPLVAFNCAQAAMCRYAKFVSLLSKLNFCMPVDTGLIFSRIPHTWTADDLYEVASKISNVDPNKLKFCVSDISRDSALPRFVHTPNSSSPVALDVSRKLPILPIPEHCYRIHRFKQVGAMVHYTPTPDPSADVDSATTPKSTHSKKVDWITLIERFQQNKQKVPTVPSRCKATPAISGLRCQEDVVTSDADVERSSSATGLLHVRPERSRNVTPERRAEPNAYNSPGPSSKMAQSFSDIPSISEEESMDDTASVASDFSRMYVSDEDERMDLSDEPPFSVADLLCEQPQLAHMYVHVHRTAHVHSGSALIRSRLCQSRLRLARAASTTPKTLYCIPEKISDKLSSARKRKITTKMHHKIGQTMTSTTQVERLTTLKKWTNHRSVNTLKDYIKGNWNFSGRQDISV